MKNITLTRISLYGFILELALIAFGVAVRSSIPLELGYFFLPVIFVVVSLIALFSKNKIQNPLFINLVLIVINLVILFVFGWVFALPVLFVIAKTLHLI